jgi:hypothetical protein
VNLDWLGFVKRSLQNKLISFLGSIYKHGDQL